VGLMSHGSDDVRCPPTWPVSRAPPIKQVAAIQCCAAGLFYLLPGGTIYVTDDFVPEVREYEDSNGRSPFGQWFWRLDPRTAARVTRIIDRLEEGLRPNVQPVGQGVLEVKMHFGPGYRVYFGLDGAHLVILLAGGDKSTQPSDIKKAYRMWAEYKARKARGTYHATNPQLP